MQKNTAFLKFHGLLKLKELFQALQIQSPVGSSQGIQIREVGQWGPWRPESVGPA